jgi:hypothetical protein
MLVRPSCRVQGLGGEQGIAFSERGNSTNLLVCCYRSPSFVKLSLLCGKRLNFTNREGHDGSRRKNVKLYRFSVKQGFR